MAELTVGSCNLHWCRSSGPTGYRPFDPVAAGAALDCDVLVLQESWAPDDGDAQHDLIAADGGYEVAAVSLGRATISPKPHLLGRPDPERHDGDGDWCLAVLSRVPVTATTVHELSQLKADRASRRVVRVDVEVDGHPLAVHGTHLAHLEMGAPLATRSLRAALAPVDQPGVLLGDMNMWWWCIGAMTPRGWRRRGRGATFPARYPVTRIDHLLTTRSVDVVSVEVAPDVGSDHLPIRARLRLGGSQ